MTYQPASVVSVGGVDAAITTSSTNDELLESILEEIKSMVLILSEVSGETP